MSKNAEETIQSTNPSSTLGPFSKGALAMLSVILLLAALCAWPGMRSLPFQDDFPQLERSAGFVHWFEIFKIDAFYFYRPFKNALFMVAAPLQNDLLAWHALGLTAFLASIIGVYRIATICLKSTATALFATAVWALSPTCVSTAIWLSCANISVGIVVASLVFHFHERTAKSFSAAALAAGVVLYAFSLLCYESMIVTPALLALRDLQQRRFSINRKMVVHYGSYALVALVFLVVRHQFSAKAIGVHDYHSAFAPDTEAYQLSLSAPWFLWRHFLMWVFPFGNLELLGSYAWLRSASVLSLAFGWVFMASLLATVVFTWRKFPAMSYGLLFFFVASLPAGNFLPSFNGPINDAYLTIPSIGLAMAFAMICERLFREFQRRRLAADYSISLLAVSLVFLLAYRLPVCGAYFRYWAGVWQDPTKLVVLMSESRPFQFQSKACAAGMLYDEGYVDQAQILAEEAHREAPWNPHAQLTLARVERLHGKFSESENFYQTILRTEHLPSYVKSASLVELAEMLYARPGRMEDAARFCREALNFELIERPLHLRAVILLAKIYKDQGNDAKARATLERGLTLHKGNGAILEQLASIGQPSSLQAPAAR